MTAQTGIRGSRAPVPAKTAREYQAISVKCDFRTRDTESKEFSLLEQALSEGPLSAVIERLSEFLKPGKDYTITIHLEERPE